jgi:hypothetical protein
LIRGRGDETEERESTNGRGRESRRAYLGRAPLLPMAWSRGRPGGGQIPQSLANQLLLEENIGDDAVAAVAARVWRGDEEKGREESTGVGGG